MLTVAMAPQSITEKMHEKSDLKYVEMLKKTIRLV